MVYQAEFVGSLDEAVGQLASGTVDPFVTAVVEGRSPAPTALPDRLPVDPGRVDIARYRHTRVDLDTGADDCGIVVLCDMMYPGWRVYVDDRPADILKVDGIFRGVCVPAGEHQVSFRFEPDSLRRGTWLMWAGLCVLVGMFVLPLVPTRRKPPPSPPGELPGT
jgi:hypothetical protein